ncbi:MAG: polysaccharide biosynthesis tyrosine autokinase [Psychroserpens sp.]|uniref:GumC family protein n=1 Tax=Psychroserpens sp. TaxID=2020870 RepID=UPI003CB22875
MNQQQNSSSSLNNNQGQAIKSEITKYFRYWYWFLIGVFISLFGAWIYLRYTPKIYATSAKIKILNKAKGLELPSSAFVFNRSNINLENEIEILKSYRIIEQVVKQIDLTVQVLEEGNVLTTEINNLPFKFVKTISNDSISHNASYNILIDKNGFQVNNDSSKGAIIIPNFNSYAVQHNLPFEIQFEDSESAAAHIGKSYILRFMTVSSATRKLKGELDVNMLGKGSDLLELSHTGQSKLRSQSILNSVVGVFDQDGISDRQKVSKRTIDFIDERFVSLAKELDSIEVDIKDFKKTNDFINIESDVELNISQRTISDSQVFDVENQIIITEILEEAIQDQQSTSELLPTNIGVGDTNINGLVGQYNDLVFELNKLGLSGGSNNPTVQILVKKLKDVQQNISASIDAYKSQLNATKQQLTKRNQKYAYQVSSLPLKEKLLRSRIRQQEIKQTLYLFLLQKREEAAINLAITEPSIKVVEYALSNGTPISPNSKNIYLTALLLGLIIPFGAIYGINLLNTKIKGKEDVVSSVGTIPILAELPKIKSGNLVFDNPTDRSVQSEAFRILSANVDYILPVTNNSDGKIIYCTSTIKGEGKTYVGINLSLALSSINKKVLLVGADLRNPQIHTYIDKDKKVAGLSNYLYDDTIDWKDMLLKGFEKHPNHQILLSGDIPPNPTQLLTNGRFKAFLDEAKGLYDYIIIDTAPTILVTDTLLISKYADATIYLVRADHTEKNLLEFSRNLSDSGKIKNMAYVINGVGARRSYGYSYNYGYGYGYGSKD